MTKKKICVIGAGNISNTRHIPAILRNKNLEIVGMISSEAKNLDRTKRKYGFIENRLKIESQKDIVSQLREAAWFRDVDAAVVGTPPMSHCEIAKACMNLGKHVLVEKPMALTPEQCDEMMDTAKRNSVSLGVMHTFNYADGMTRMDKRYRAGEFGELRSIFELQLTNRDRRLPRWYNELPLGLFFDEAAHFFYIAMRFGNGSYSVSNAYAHWGETGENTPLHLEIQGLSGIIPVQTYMNFSSPVCEWCVMLLCSRKIAVYDFFKDILIVADNDNSHLAKDVLKSSLQYTFGYWRDFISNGLKMITGNLLYGHDKSIDEFMKNAGTGNEVPYLSPLMGKKVVEVMHEVLGHIGG